MTFMQAEQPYNLRTEPMGNQISEQFVKTIEAQLVRHEGEKLKPYRCPAGKWTIGVGRNLEDRGITTDELVKIFRESGITEEQSRTLLRNDINATIQQLNRHLSEVFNSLNDSRKAVLVDMAFNMGIGGLLKFKRMIQALGVRDYERAAIEMLDSRWARQVGRRANNLSEQMKRG